MQSTRRTLLFLVLISALAFAFPALAQSVAAPTSLSASATSASSASITWTVVPESGCTGGGIDYYVRAIHDSSGHWVDAFTAIGRPALRASAVSKLAHNNIEAFAYCWGNDSYSSAASTSVTIPSTSSSPAPTVRDNSLGTAQPTNLAASASSGTVTVTWNQHSGPNRPYRTLRCR